MWRGARPSQDGRAPRHLSFSFNDGREAPPPLIIGEKRGRTDVPWVRRPARRLAVTNACVRGRQASHRRQAISDRLSCCHQNAESPFRLSDRLFVWAGGWVAFVSLCLRGCDGLKEKTLYSLLCVSVPLWFFRPPTNQGTPKWLCGRLR